MVRNMVANLLRHETMHTTVAKAKVVRPWAEKMITLGKKGTLHARRQALAFLRSKPAVAKLFRTIGPRYQGRNGGYTRILKLAEALRQAGSDKLSDFKMPAGYRLGDGTPMAIIELVEADIRPRDRRRGPAPEPFKPRRELHGKGTGEAAADAAGTAEPAADDGAGAAAGQPGEGEKDKAEE